MECDETNVNQSSVDKIPVEKNDSVDSFQKFIYELFDKNGILNDLRAYLRRHIVNVLDSAQTGDPPLCQKHFTQRLELVSQALNILVAEYLLQMDFTYTLSVFVSEIPLSNMVFDFAKDLLKGTSTVPCLKFEEGDVWSVLNYLGVKCDSEHASNIVQMYQNEERVPLLFCILKGMPMYRKEPADVDEEISSRDSLASSANSMDTVGKRGKIYRNTSCHENCTHYRFCKSCQNRILRVKEKYRERKKAVYKGSKMSSVSPLIEENFMKNINVMEKRIIDEMFEQLHSVYENEVELVRQEEESKVRRTLASHAIELQQRREEIEASLKSKEEELESSAQHKKQFLWGVARSLRDQHEHVARAMTLLREEQEMLAMKENNLKTQVLQAEETLRNKGEEMRIQISKELATLEGHLESMKRERDSIDRERSELENLKAICDSKTKLIEATGEKEKDDVKQNYDVLKDEIAVLKKYIESSKVSPKCVVEKSTITEFVEVPSNVNVLNNTSLVERNSRIEANDREARPPNQLVNDLKKQKNVNFSQSNRSETYHELNGGRSRCSVSSEEAAVRASDRDSALERDTIQRLMEENESLKDYARQQREHISALWSERGRPRTAPALLPAANYFTVHRVNPNGSVNTFGWRKGAGEELGLFPAERPPLLPGDPIPFVGILRDRHGDNRRHLINQWRALKRRSSPLTRVSKLRPPIPIQRERDQLWAKSALEAVASALPAVRIADEQPDPNGHASTTREIVQSGDDKEAGPASKGKYRQKKPKPVLKETKLTSRNKGNVQEKLPLQKRDHSPNSMLREAKLRLRKLEIEAEAVEKSYLDFRKRQAELREERKPLPALEDHFNLDVVNNLNGSCSRSLHKFTNNTATGTTIPSRETYDITTDFDKYLLDYQTKFDIGKTHFKNKNTTREKVNPIPIAYSKASPKKEKVKNVDYLETPLMEFRKLYHAEKERNSSPLRFSTKLKSDVIYCHGKMVVNSEDLTNVISRREQEITKDSVNSQDLHDVKTVNNISESRNKNYDETNTDKDISNDLHVSKTPEDDTDGKAQLEFEEKSNAQDLMKQIKHLETLKKIKSTKAELEILTENINQNFNVKSSHSISSVDSLNDVTTRVNLENANNTDKQHEDKQVLRVEVEENTYEVNKVKMSESKEGELVIVVQSSVTTNESKESEVEAIESTPISVDISPKRPKHELDREETQKSKSDSPEKAAQLTRDDVLNAIFQADDKKTSSVDMHLELSKDDLKISSDPEKDPYGDYPDDFSADVDNYNSRSEYGFNSPISLPKSENDNFWDN